MDHHRSTKVCVCAWLLIAAGSAHAQSAPKWEAGAGAAVVAFPKYRGSNEHSTWLLPLPYVIYRGDVLRMDERRNRGVFYDSDLAEVEVSLSGTVPVKSSETEARRGMPDLDPTLEIGPAINLKLAGGPQQPASLQLRVAVRAVLATDLSHFHHSGWVLQPNIAYDLRDPFGQRGWKLGLLAGPMAGDRAYHRYVYGVDPAYATASRRAYEAPAGYGGVQATAALSKRFPHFWVGAFARWDNLGGAAFADSPLVRAHTGVTAGIGIAWVLRESSERVERRD